MVLTATSICAVRGRTSPATDVYEFTFQNLRHRQPRCRPCATRAREVDDKFDRWLDDHLSR
ncbi:hypothetical protein ACWF82_20930 [Nocardia sp. NPDC055053]